MQFCFVLFFFLQNKPKSERRFGARIQIDVFFKKIHGAVWVCEFWSYCQITSCIKTTLFLSSNVRGSFGSFWVELRADTFETVHTASSRPKLSGLSGS